MSVLVSRSRCSYIITITQTPGTRFIDRVGCCFLGPQRSCFVDDWPRATTNNDRSRTTAKEITSRHPPNDETGPSMSPSPHSEQRSSNSPAELALPAHSFDHLDPHSAKDPPGHGLSSIYPHSTPAYDMSRAASSGPTSVSASGSRSQPYQLVSPGTPADPRAMSQVSPGFIFVMFPMFACFALPSPLLFHRSGPFSARLLSHVSGLLFLFSILSEVWGLD